MLDTALKQHSRADLSTITLEDLRARLRQFYEAGPGKSVANDLGNDAGEAEETDESANVAKPIPAETFLEELSQKLRIHPISVYWLLEELRAEGVRCKPEELRLLEDRLSVLALGVLGHRWPRQLEAGEGVPDWAVADGIAPLVSGLSSFPPLADRVRDRLRAEDGDLGAQQAEALLAELTSLSLEAWLRRTFFTRHVRQFKYRPVAWHLSSTPRHAPGTGKGVGKGKGSRAQTPAFECLVYYHACGTGLLARLRTGYVGPLLQAERERAHATRAAGDDTVAALATARMHELEDFATRLREVEERGFACEELDELLAGTMGTMGTTGTGTAGTGETPALPGDVVGELLDRWSNDGYLTPATRADLQRAERAWAVDSNDGVRVNVAPLQLAGLLAAPVLKEADARKALADRARWRADERRWTREGVLPRPGWMPESVPESPRWTERAPQREAERQKLDAKRAEARAKLAGMGTSNRHTGQE